MNAPLPGFRFVPRWRSTRCRRSRRLSQSGQQGIESTTTSTRGPWCMDGDRPDPDPMHLLLRAQRRRVLHFTCGSRMPSSRHAKPNGGQIGRLAPRPRRIGRRLVTGHRPPGAERCPRPRRGRGGDAQRCGSGGAGAGAGVDPAAKAAAKHLAWLCPLGD